MSSDAELRTTTTCSAPTGAPTHPDRFSQIFNKTVARAAVPRRRLHDLRHTHATLLLKAGVPVKVVSERLGHANAAFTMSVYQHVLPGMQAEAAATFADLLRTPSAVDESGPSLGGAGDDAATGVGT